MNRPFSFNVFLAFTATTTAVIAGCASNRAITPTTESGRYSAADASPLFDDGPTGSEADDPFSGLDLDQYAKDLEFMKSRQEAGSAPSGEMAESGLPPARGSNTDRKVIWLENGKTQPTSLSANEAFINDDSQDSPVSATMRNTDDQSDVVRAVNTQRPPVVSMNSLLVPFKGQLARQAADSSTPLRERLVASALLMLGGEDPVDPETLYDLTESEREIFSAYQAHFVSLRDLWDEGADTEAIRASVHEFLNSLVQSPGLRLNNFSLCSRIVNFGLYDKVKTTNFQAMQATRVLTYVEIENFASNPGADGTFTTRLRHEVELYTERDGTLVYSWPALPAEDRCGRIRRDFFLPRQITLPANLTTGRYRLKIRITDEQTQEQAESVLPISIIAGGDWADNR